MLRTSAFSAIFKTASRVATYQVAQPAARLSPIAVGRFYSAGAGLDRSDVESRILEILKGFDKIDPSKVMPSFSNVIS
jgi:NADH dehydrogenase (ubiquinone) 1 alpha/beta subcomplex 1